MNRLRRLHLVTQRYSCTVNGTQQAKCVIGQLAKSIVSDNRVMIENSNFCTYSIGHFRLSSSSAQAMRVFKIELVNNRAVNLC